MRNQRDWATNVTTLSGDIGAVGTLNDNSYHVVTGSGADATAVLDGFTITGGNAYGSAPHNAGGGMYNSTGSPTLTNVAFRANSAEQGGGIFNNSSSASLTNVTFSDNSAEQGGGMYNSAGSPTLTNVTLSGNSAEQGGGGLFNAGSSPTLTNVTFSDNSAEQGGGMHNSAASSPALTNVTFSGNAATSLGGGIYNSSRSPVVRNSILWDNTTPSGGAQIYDDNSTPTVSASVVQGGYAGGTNILTDDPLLGALGNYGSATQTMPLLPGSAAIDAASTNCPATDQRGIARGTTCDLGAFESRGFTLARTGGDNQSTFLNIAFTNPLALSVTSVYSEPVDGGAVTFSAPASGASTHPATNTAIIAGGAVSQSVVANGTAGSYTVTAGAKGAGSALAFALQNEPLVILYAKPGGLTGGACESWANACELRYALPNASAGQELWAKAGTHTPDATGDRTATFQLKTGVALYGGFAGTETLRNQRDWATNVTTLSGDIGAVGTLNDNSYHVVTGSGADATAVLDGFTITGGNAYGSAPHNAGGGMYNSTGSPTLTNVAFRANSAEQGGGIFNNSSSASLTNVTFSDNSAEQGGGMYNSAGSPTLTNVTLSGNSAEQGGGMHNDSASGPSLTSVTFSGNTAISDGGGIFNAGSSPALTNVAFSANTAEQGGGIHNSAASSPTLTNVTFSGNTATAYGGGIYNSTSTPTLVNSILWSNSAGSGGVQIYEDAASSVTATYSDVQGGWSGTGNLDADPRFVDADGADNVAGTADDNLRLRGGSPVIDAGSNAAVPAGVTTDLDGAQRIANGVVDMGAYEYHPWYVNDDGAAGNGCTSWSDACPDLQTALGQAIGGNEVWVAAGTYRPTASDDRMATFQLKSGVALYGGFAGSETLRSERDWAADVTTLSGDIGTLSVVADNSYHVVTGSGTDATAVLDGFTITGGKADGSAPHNAGGGMTNSGGSPTVTNVTFSGNSANNGGGMNAQNDSNPTLTNVTFSGNDAGDYGGGIYHNSSSPTLTNVTISSNDASQGGGIYNNFSSPLLTNVTLSGNYATVGGGMLNYSSSPMLAQVTFSGNAANISGGGMQNEADSSPSLNNVTFSGNAAEFGDGGGMSNYSSSPTLTNVTLSGNFTVWWGNGGGIYNASSSPTLTNVTLSGNSTGFLRGNGGGIYNGSSSPTLTNVTFSSNAAKENGGAMYNSASTPTLANSILWGNTAYSSGAQIYNASSTPSIAYCDIQDAFDTSNVWDANLGTDGGGNRDADPLFVDGLHLAASSPAIDAGSNDRLPVDTADLDGDGDMTEPIPFDRGGNPRIVNGTVDMGAYEYQIPPPTPVVTASSIDNNVVLTFAYGGAEVSYQVWHSSSPYFTPVSEGTDLGDICTNDGVTVTCTVENAVGGSGLNSFYVVRAVYATGAYADSDRTGVFGFALMPGE